MAQAMMRGLNAGKLPWDKVSCAHFEQDDFFCTTGKYVFNADQADRAQLDCIRRTRKAMESGVQFIFVSNPFVRLFEVESYVRLAKSYGYRIQEVIVAASFQNTHKVPPEAIERMRKHFQVRPHKYILGDSLNHNITDAPDVSIPI